VKKAERGEGQQKNQEVPLQGNRGGKITKQKKGEKKIWFISKYKKKGSATGDGKRSTSLLRFGGGRSQETDRWPSRQFDQEKVDWEKLWKKGRHHRIGEKDRRRREPG